MYLDNVIIKHAEYGYCKANITINNEIISKISIIQTLPIDYKDSEFYATPGFVNSHLHPNQLYDRRLLDGLPITELLHQMHGNYKKTDEDRYVQALLVLIEAIKSGATSIYAVASNPYPVLKAFKAIGIKGAVTCFYNDQWEGHGDSPTLHQSIEAQFLAAHREKTDKVDVHIGSASIQSASNHLLTLMNELARRCNSKVNIHISEGIESVHSCQKSRGTSPIRLLAQLGVLSAYWNLIHAVNIDEEEVSLIANAGATVIHCPVSNAKTGVGIAPIKALMQAGVTIGLGTDACSNNNTNNILNEAYFATLIQSAQHLEPKMLEEATLMKWMITNGYKILGKHPETTLREGAPADLLLWSLHHNAFVPVPYGNFDSTLIFNAPDIKPHTVLVDGKPVVENYQFKIFSEEDIRDKVNACGAIIFDYAKSSRDRGSLKLQFVFNRSKD